MHFDPEVAKISTKNRAIPVFLRRPIVDFNEHGNPGPSNLHRTMRINIIIVANVFLRID